MSKINLTGRVDQSNQSIEVLYLKVEQIKLIDKLLSEVGDFGEVHLVKDHGKLRFVRKITSENADGRSDSPNKS